MKKFAEANKFINGVLFLAALVLFGAGCSKNTERQVRKPSANINSAAWIDNLIDGKAAAQKEDKKIFLFFSADDQDESSRQFKDNVFMTEEFITSATKDYVLVNLDFSNIRFEESQVDPIAPEEEKSAAKAKEARLEEDLHDASLYNIQGSPSFFLLTKEGYVITEIIFDDVITSVAEFENAMAAKSEQIIEYMNVLDSTKNGSVTERVSAIERLFDITPTDQRFPLKEFSKTVLELDKKNETGLVSKHAIALANANAMEFFLEQNAEAASEEYAKIAKNKFLTAQEKQQAYYTAGYLLFTASQTGDTNYEKIMEYFQKSYDADPESAYAETIQSALKSIEEMKAEFEKEVEAAGE